MARSTIKDEKLKILMALNISRIRQEKGLRIQDVALALGLSRPTISNIEGARQIATADTVFKMSVLFNCEISDLFPKKEECDIVLNEITMSTKLALNAKLMNRLEELNQKVTF